MTCNNYANVVHARWFACVWSDVSWCCVLAGARMLTRAAGAMRVGVAVRTTCGGKACRAKVQGLQRSLRLRQRVWTSSAARPPPGHDLPCRYLLRDADPNYFLRFGLRTRIISMLRDADSLFSRPFPVFCEQQPDLRTTLPSNKGLDPAQNESSVG